MKENENVNPKQEIIEVEAQVTEKCACKKGRIIKWVAIGATLIGVGYLIGNQKARKGLTKQVKKGWNKISGSKKEPLLLPDVVEDEVVMTISPAPEPRRYNPHRDNNYRPKNNWNVAGAGFNKNENKVN